jgi:hypothetical protein
VCGSKKKGQRDWTVRIDCKATEIFKKDNSERAPKVDVYCGG